jgi:hypothetical protein
MAKITRRGFQNHGRQDRIDHWIFEEDTKKFIYSRLARRLFPEITKAFHYSITAYERMHIGCYQGERGGKLHGHRDNVEPPPIDDLPCR